MSDSPEETEYYLRFISMYIDLCTGCVYKVFLHVIPDNDITSFFHTNYKLFFNLEKRQILSQKEINFVVSPKPKPETFDISLLIKLLCNTRTTLSPPLEGWESQPGPSDLSVAADLLRLRKIRNIVIGHRPRAKLPRYKFERLWEEVENILIRITKTTDSGAERALTEAIDGYKKMHLHSQQESENVYLTKLQEWWKTCEEVKGLQMKMEDLLQKTQEIVLFFKTKPQHYCRYIRLLCNGGQSVLLGILKKELSSKGLDLATVLTSTVQLKTALTDNMVTQVFPNATTLNANCDTWDILTLATVVLHIFRIDLEEDVVGEIKVIENAIRNYAKTAVESFDSMKFQYCCEDLVSSIKTLSNFVGGETRRDCKTRIEEYRNTDDKHVDVDYYFDQMKLHAHEIRTISDIYKETFVNLKECVRQMMEEGVEFESDKDLELKMVTLGENSEKKIMAEQILETVWQSALSMSDSPDEFASVRYEVDRILTKIKTIYGLKTTKVKKLCIILTIRYSSWSGLFGILEYVESCQFRESLENISSELGDVCGETMIMQGNITMESLHNILTNLDRNVSKQDVGFSVPISCSSAESMREVFALLVCDDTTQSFRNIGVALSKHVGGHISVHAYPDVNRFSGLFEDEEKPNTESINPANGLQLSEARNLLDQGRVIGEESGDMYNSISSAIDHKSKVSFQEIDPDLQKEELDKVALFGPKYIKEHVAKLLIDHQKEFMSLLTLLEEQPFIRLHFKLKELNTEHTLDDYYSSVLFDVAFGQDCYTHLSLRLYAAATCLNIPIYILYRNELGHLQWLYFPPLFKFENQPCTLQSYLTMYLSPMREFFVLNSQNKVPEPKAYGILGMYLTVLDDTPIDNIEVPETLLTKPDTFKEHLCYTIDESVMGECWCVLSRHGFKIKTGIPERTEFYHLVKHSENAFEIVCKVLIKRRKFQMLADQISDFEAFVHECKYLGCHRKVCELDEATVERNSVVVNVVTEYVDEKLTLLSRKRTRYAKSATEIVSFTLVLAGLILSYVNSDATIGLLVLGAALALCSSKIVTKATEVEKLISEKVTVLRAKERTISEELKVTKELFEKANPIGVSEDPDVKRKVGSGERPLPPVGDIALKAGKMPLTSSSSSAAIVAGLSLALDFEYLAVSIENKLLTKTKYADKKLQDAVKIVDCKHRVFNSIFRGNFEDSERMVTMERMNAKIEI